MEEFFATLKLSPDATKDEIRKAFHLWKEKQQIKMNRGSNYKAAYAELIRMTTIYKDLIMGRVKPEFGESKFVKLAQIETTSTMPKIEESKVEIDPIEPVIESEERLQKTLYELRRVERVPMQENQMTSEFVSRASRKREKRSDRKNSSLIVPAAAIVLGVLLGNLIFTFAEKVEVESYEQNLISDQNSGQTKDQRAAIQILYSFHDSITQKNFRSAYGYLTPSYRSMINFEGWAAGFKTTVSSSVSNVQVAKDLGDRIVLTYSLMTSDAPGGNSKFVGTALMVKTSDGWRINEIINIAK